MNWVKRKLRNWLGLRYDYPHRFVSLMYWRDNILAVDGNGDIYQLNMDAYGGPYVQLFMQNPLEGRR